MKNARKVGPFKANKNNEDFFWNLWATNMPEIFSMKLMMGMEQHKIQLPDIGSTFSSRSATNLIGV